MLKSIGYQMNRSTLVCPPRKSDPKLFLLPSKTHISYKEQEKNLLLYEKELMDHYGMNRSDLHKHLIRNAYTMLKMPQIGF